MVQHNEMIIATKSDWKTLEMPDEHEVFFLEREFAPEQMNRYSTS